MKRQTKAAQIRNMPPSVAHTIAKWGRLPDQIELEALEWRRRCLRQGDKVWAEILGNIASKKFDALTFEFMAAMQDRNGAALRKVAKIVETFRFDRKDGDMPRMNALWLKERAAYNKLKLSKAQIREALGGGDKRQLDRIIADVKFPTRKTPPGRPRKIGTFKPQKTS